MDSRKDGHRTTKNEKRKESDNVKIHNSYHRNDRNKNNLNNKKQ